jgi:K+-transporting ATPase KdpF subunit
MNTTLLLIQADTQSAASYLLGAAITVLILGYLIYTLIKPEKF